MCTLDDLDNNKAAALENPTKKQWYVCDEVTSVQEFLCMLRNGDADECHCDQFWVDLMCVHAYLFYGLACCVR